MMLPGLDAEMVTVYITPQISFQDLFFALIMFISFFIFTKRKLNYSFRKPFFLFLCFLFLSIVAIFKNLPKYQINSLGEFRHTYLILFMPFWLAFIEDEEKVIKIIKSIIRLILIVSPIIYITISIIFRRGTILQSFSAANRIFTSEINLAILLSLVAYFIFVKYNVIRSNPIFKQVILYSNSLILLLDFHRSVVTVFLAIMLYLIFKRELKVNVWYIIGGSIVLFLLLYGAIEKNLFDYIFIRSEAFYDPQGDETSYWRLLNWEYQLQRFFLNPIFGQGFGAYWGLTEQRWDVGLMPHNLYIMILAKLGITGLIMFLLLLYFSFHNFNKILKFIEFDEYKRHCLMLLGSISVLTIFIYGFSYSLDFRLSWIFLGLSFSALNEKYSNSYTSS